MIHESIHRYITQIARQSSRVLRVTLGRCKSKMPIQIRPTYAPRNGHAEAERRQHWEEVKEIFNRICKRHMTIWRADANGQLGRDKEAEKTKSPQENITRSKIGPYTRGNRKRERNSTRKNMPNTTDDTDDNMVRAEQENRTHGKIQTTRKYD